MSASRTKNFLRRLAVWLGRGLLRLGSEPFELQDAPTVIIAPHPDDETLACGGIIARKRNEGLPVHVIFITDGAASHPGHARFGPADIARLRHREALQALACLGVESLAIHFLDEPDGSLRTIAPERRAGLVARLAGLLRAIEPGEIFLPCHPDGSSEHDAVFGFVLDATAAAGRQPTLWQYPLWTWWNPRLLLRRWAGASDCRRQPLEDFLAAKHRAIACYESQTRPLAPDVAAPLPEGLVDVFRSDCEFFFRFELPPSIR